MGPLPRSPLRPRSDLLRVVNGAASRTVPLGYLPVYGRTWSCGATPPVDLANRRTDGWARQPFLSCTGLGVTVVRMFSVAFRELLATNPQSSQTYKPRSTRFESAFIPHSQQVIDVISEYSSTAQRRSHALQPCTRLLNDHFNALEYIH